jgi:multiple sugar transport system permease protein
LAWLIEGSVMPILFEKAIEFVWLWSVPMIVTKTTNAAKTANDDWDFNASAMTALVCAAVLLIALIFMPWLGTKISANGMRLLSDNLYGTAGAIPTPYLWIVPVVALASISVALWGTLASENAKASALINAGLGLAGLTYFALNTKWAALSDPRYGGMGLGYKISLIALAGLVIQILLAAPAVNGGIQRLNLFVSRRFPETSPKVVPYLFLIPPLLLYFAWIIAPTLYTIYLSFTNWDGISPPKWIGISNYRYLISKDPNFIESLTNNVRWLIIFITIPTTVGLGMAMIFNTEMRGGKFYKVSFYAPLVLSLPVIGLMWAWIYNPYLGLINNTLRLFGMEDPPGWLGDRQLAIWCIIVAAVWRQVGYVMVLYLAGLKNIDPNFIDAARVDGANRWQLFRHVIFPLLAPVTTIIVVISVIDSLRAFDLVSVMTRGGQGTQVLANFMYIEAFNNYRMGYGAAIAVVLFAISLIFIGFYLTRVAKEETEY